MLPQLPADKANHFIYGAAMATAGALAAIGPLAMPQRAWLFAAAAALVGGVVKEATDWARNRKAPRGSEVAHVEMADGLATAAGALPVALPLLVTTLIARSV